MRTLRVVLAVVGGPVLLLFASCRNPVASVPESISGVVSVAGYGIPGVTVTVGSQSATTGSSGAYTISGVADNRSYTVTPSKSGYSFSPTSASVTTTDTGVTGVDFDAGPALPVPTSYTQNLANTSNEILIAAKTWNLSFTPSISGAYVTTTSPNYSGWETSACTTNNPTGEYFALEPYDSSGKGTGLQRAQLMDASGSIVASPSATGYLDLTMPNCSVAAAINLKPITQKPTMELTAYWQLLSVNRFPAGTDTTVSQSVTYGVSTTQTTSFTNTFNYSAGLNIEGFSA